DGADRLDGGDAGTYQLLLELVAPMARAGIEVGLRPARPAPEGDLVDGRIERCVDALVLHQLRDRAGVAGEALDELRAPDVDIVRVAVVAKVPDHLQLTGPSRVQHGQEAAPVVSAGLALYQVPAQPVAGAA